MVRGDAGTKRLAWAAGCCAAYGVRRRVAEPTVWSVGTGGPIPEDRTARSGLYAVRYQTGQQDR